MVRSNMVRSKEAVFSDLGVLAGARAICHDSSTKAGLLTEIDGLLDELLTREGIH